MESMPPTVFERIELLLTAADVAYKVLRHEPVYTSEEAARVRGVPLSSGAKALICKAEGGFLMFVIPADRRLDSRRVRRERGYRKLRFAGREEVLELTGLTSGAIPPFGSLFDMPTFCDRRLGDQQRINFNAGDHCISVSMRFADYLELEKPELGIWAE
jgi:Ala-tRNA(Pro) deacylase